MPAGRFDIQMTNRTSVPLNETFIRKIVCAILAALAFERAALSVLFVSDRRIRSLNRRYLNHDRPTDVMAFSQLEGRLCRRHDESVPFLGDIVISTETAARQAREYGNGFLYELSLYLCHGILHLLGWDDSTPAAGARMGRKQQRILKTIGISDPGIQRTLWPSRKPKRSS